MLAGENSILLYFSLKHNADLDIAMQRVESVFGECAVSNPHITVTAEKDMKKVSFVYDQLKKADYPFELTVSKVELYKIWNPIELIR